MPTLADVVRQHGPAYRERFGATLLPSHARAMRDIVGCRTAAIGAHVLECVDCGERHLVFHSCKSRACARCGGERARNWVERQREQLLPVPYFHVVFTVPAELRGLVRTHQKKLIRVLFRAAFESLAALCADPRHLGGAIGALAVLHTWTRTLGWHPHMHLLVPGGALSQSGTWLVARRGRKKQHEPFLVPVRALSEKFWGRFLALARKAVPNATFPDMPREKKWVVHIKSVLHGPERVLEYLGRYIHRTALSDRAIVACDERQVTFRYHDNRDGRRKLMTLPGEAFLRRFLQHVPPRGLHRVRAFGLLHPSRRVTLRRLQLTLRHAPRERPPPEAKGEAPCRHCGSTTWLRGPRLSPEQCAVLIVELVDRADGLGARAPPVETAP
jgi:hypothetical protein